MSSLGGRGSPYKEDVCCVMEDGERCINFSTQVTFSKKMKALAQRKHNLILDPSVSDDGFYIPPASNINCICLIGRP